MTRAARLGMEGGGVGDSGHGHDVISCSGRGSPRPTPYRPAGAAPPRAFHTIVPIRLIPSLVDNDS